MKTTIGWVVLLIAVVAGEQTVSIFLIGWFATYNFESELKFDKPDCFSHEKRRNPVLRNRSRAF